MASEDTRERIARAIFGSVYTDGPRSWAATTEKMREEYRRFADAALAVVSPSPVDAERVLRDAFTQARWCECPATGLAEMDQHADLCLWREIQETLTAALALPKHESVTTWGPVADPRFTCRCGQSGDRQWMAQHLRYGVAR